MIKKLIFAIGCMFLILKLIWSIALGRDCFYPGIEES
jgi:hypothetical protein